jgi:hypothetical protein
MKRFAGLLIVLPFWYFALVVNHHDAFQFGPFATELQCNTLATQMTTPPVLPLSPFLFVGKSTASACWSDS